MHGIHQVDILGFNMKMVYISIAITLISIVYFGVLFYFFVSGYMVSLTNGVSMLPTIPDKSLVIAKKDMLPKIGDIAIFEVPIKNHKLRIVHRLVNIIENNGSIIYVFRGDNNPPMGMEYVKPEQILGTAIIIIPYGYLLFIVLASMYFSSTIYLLYYAIKNYNKKSR